MDPGCSPDIEQISSPWVPQVDEGKDDFFPNDLVRQFEWNVLSDRTDCACLASFRTVGATVPLTRQLWKFASRRTATATPAQS